MGTNIRHKRGVKETNPRCNALVLKEDEAKGVTLMGGATTMTTIADDNPTSHLFKDMVSVP